MNNNPDSSPIERRLWFKALSKDELKEGQVKTVYINYHTLCMTHFDAKYGALDNRCPHQGASLGDGTIKNGLLRCPHHGMEFCPIEGNHSEHAESVESYPVEMRSDGIYVSLPVIPPPSKISLRSDHQTHLRQNRPSS
ncbi:Naphthalene 1,2-dioxygenase/salicylate 5-hydroxylase systems, ferredoxin component [Gimesia chilikensis]|uniref:Naphthalene 1,2-dioxygenase/salicylate 5-hydroxylase systems, ferredoxin component n=1 Tax=Gimesia chilikensis TaxID=2605989 RepID=A0A517W8V8_9PLAN|nr:Naphthalene 1,2-dioxygenase/salicylate 5-hydroxylase systems, ferredoxin component [Gimesia chilikensis]